MADPYQLPARACSTQRGRPWPRSRARSTAAKAAAAVPAPEATRATGPRRRTRPMQIKPADPGRLPAERAQTSRTSPSSLTRTQVWPKVHSALLSKRTRAVYTSHASNPSRRRIWAQRTVVLGTEPPPPPERGLRPLPDMQHRIGREPVVHEPRGLVNQVPSGGPACPARGHRTGQAALRHGSIVLRLPGPRKRTLFGITWVIEDHLRPSGHIIPDHAGDRGAVFLVLAPHDHLHISQSRMPDGCAGARRSPRSVAVDEIQQEVGLPPVTVGIRAADVGVTAGAGYVR